MKPNFLAWKSQDFLRKITAPQQIRDAADFIANLSLSDITLTNFWHCSMQITMPGEFHLPDKSSTDKIDIECSWSNVIKNRDMEIIGFD